MPSGGVRVPAIPSAIKEAIATFSDNSRVVLVLEQVGWTFMVRVQCSSTVHVHYVIIFLRHCG